MTAEVKEAVRPVPLSSPFIDERDEELVLEVLRSGRLSLGPAIDRFEEMFAEKLGVPYAAAVSSGTAGLHLLCRIAGLREGDEVITSPYSFVASANCFIYEGATPVFADIDERTMNLDPAAVEAAVTERTRAVVAVDIFGYPCELDELRAVCDRVRESLGSAVVVLAADSDGAASVLVGVTPDRVSHWSANDIVRQLVPLIDGRGGGKPDFAQAGGKNPSGIAALLEKANEILV